ncbi:MAG: rhomboid family intramembrane serine protease [Limisphaerales bacterium]
MRVIGHLPDETSARKFGELLWSKSINNDVEPDDDGSWMVWVIDEDQLDAAKAEFDSFDPAKIPEDFASVARRAKAVRDELAAQDKKAKVIKRRRDLFVDMRAYGIGPITVALIAVCVLVTYMTNWGGNERADDLFIEKTSQDQVFPQLSRNLSRVKSGEVWRLITPCFMHGTIFHLFFNCWILLTFGAMIEGRKSPGYLMAMVIVAGVLSNLLQYYMTNQPRFLGFSGVNYALFGYLWMKGRYAASEGMGLAKPTIIFLLVWFFLCFSNLVGHIANWAHAGGLIVGILWGLITSPGSFREILRGR